MNSCEINGHSGEEILNKFKEIMDDTKKLTSKQIETKYMKFKEIFPKLYEMAINNEGQKSIDTLSMMLKITEKKQEGKLNTFESNLAVGEELGKKYIYNKVGYQPSKEDYIRAISMLQKNQQ